jgi:O-antigen/teichoic acid export membrane protein
MSAMFAHPSAKRVRALVSLLLGPVQPASGSPRGHSDDPAGTRGKERNRRATLSVASAIGGRGLTLALSLLTVPLTLNYLGTERYGMWIAISSMIALLAFSDLGIGYGLLNAVTRTIATGEFAQARRQISSSIVLLTLVALILGGLFIVIHPFIPWASVLAVESPKAKSEAGPAIATWFAIFLIGIPISVASQVRIARQEVYLVHMTAAAGNVASVLALLVVILTRQGVPALVVAMAAPPVVAAGVNGILLFRSSAPELRPSTGFVDMRTGFGLMRSGLLFLVLQMAMTIAFTTDTLVIAQILGPSAVAEYGVASRLFAFPLGLVAIGLLPLWPAYGDAIARGDVKWARTTLVRSAKTALSVTIPAAGFLVLFGGWIIAIWVGGSVTPPFLLLLGLGIWTIQSTVGNSVAMLLNGANELRFQAIAAAAMAAANLGLSIWLTFQMGVAGVVYGTVIAYGALVLIPMAFYVPGVLRRIDSRRAGATAPRKSYGQ